MKTLSNARDPHIRFLRQMVDAVTSNSIRQLIRLFRSHDYPICSVLDFRKEQRCDLKLFMESCVSGSAKCLNLLLQNDIKFSGSARWYNILELAVVTGSTEFVRLFLPFSELRHRTLASLFGNQQFIEIDKLIYPNVDPKLFNDYLDILNKNVCAKSIIFYNDFIGFLMQFRSFSTLNESDQINYFESAAFSGSLKWTTYFSNFLKSIKFRVIRSAAQGGSLPVVKFLLEKYPNTPLEPEHLNIRPLSRLIFQYLVHKYSMKTATLQNKIEFIEAFGLIGQPEYLHSVLKSERFTSEDNTQFQCFIESVCKKGPLKSLKILLNLGARIENKIMNHLSEGFKIANIRLLFSLLDNPTIHPEAFDLIINKHKISDAIFFIQYLNSDNAYGLNQIISKCILNGELTILRQIFEQFTISEPIRLFIPFGVELFFVKSNSKFVFKIAAAIEFIRAKGVKILNLEEYFSSFLCRYNISEKNLVLYLLEKMISWKCNLNFCDKSVFSGHGHGYGYGLPFYHKFIFPRSGSFHRLKRLIAEGIDLSLSDSETDSILHRAISEGYPMKIIQLIIDNSIDINQINANGETALSFAVIERNPDAIYSLLSRNAKNLDHCPTNLANQFPFFVKYFYSSNLQII